MSTPKVYLAGPITGQTFDGAVDWREEATNLLAPDICVYSPMRGKSYLVKEDRLMSSHYEQPLSTPSAIVARDRFDVMNADLILVNFTGAERVSIGTVGEIFWADAFRKPVMAIMDDLHDHAMIRQLVGWFAEDVEDACSLIRLILLP